ncbi:MAG: methyltransferase domain-containing protein [Lysobacterales bacterium]
MTSSDQDTICISCGRSTFFLFLDLGMQPSGNTFVTKADSGEEKFYPLRMGVCQSCWQVQLQDRLDSNLLFDNHPYLTSTNKPMVDHFGLLAARITQDFGLCRGDLVLDIGCNDGTFLTKFRDQGVLTMGVEPSSQIAKLSSESGHVVANTFWNGSMGRDLSRMGIRPKVITAMSVFYHVSDLNDFVAGVEQVMADDGVFVIQAVSLMSLLAKNQFDHFYHEHTCIHSLSTIQTIVGRQNLVIIDVDEVDVHGGSLIVYVARPDAGFDTTARVAALAEKEIASGLQKMETYTEFAGRVEKIAGELKRKLIELKQQGKSVYGLGAPLKSTTFLNYANIDGSLIECLTEVNDLKIGKLSPGLHIPVVDERTLEKEPDYYVVFAWNYLDYLLEKKQDYLEAGGSFIVPFPHLKIISADYFGQT